MLFQTFHQGDITFRFLWATVWVRPPLPVPRRSKPCIACSGFLCACTAASDAPSANAPRRGAHGASEPSSRNHRGPGHIEPGTGRIYHPPLRGGIIKPRRKSGAGPGGHTGRPYERTEGGSVGADYISARAHRRVGCTIALSGGRYDAMVF